MFTFTPSKFWFFFRLLIPFLSGPWVYAGEEVREPQPIYSWKDRWLEPPLPDFPREQEITLANFPIMANGLDQIALIDLQFPAEGNLNPRRAALQRTLQYFPQDGEAAFRVRIRQAELAYLEGRPQEAWLETKGMLDAPPPGVFRGELRWAESKGVMFLAEAGREAEALALARKLIVEQKAVPHATWKARAYYYAGKLLAARSPNDALTNIRAGLAMESTLQADLFALQIRVLEEHGRAAEVRAELKQLVAQPPPQAAAMLARAARETELLFPTGHLEQAEALLALMDQAAAALPPDRNLADTLTQAHATVQAFAAAPAMQEKLRAYLSQNPPDEVDAAGKKLTKEAELARAAEQALCDHDPTRSLRYGLEILSHLKPEADYDVRLWHTILAADSKETAQGRPEPLLAELLDLAEDLPKRGRAYVECRKLRAEGCKRRGDFTGARAIHEQVRQMPGLPHWARLAMDYELALDREQERDYPGALELYRQLILAPASCQGQDASVRGALLSLEMNEPKAALQFLSPYFAEKPPVSRSAHYAWQLVNLVSLARDAERARDYWVDAGAWWPAWEEFEAKIGLAPLGERQLVPALEAAAGETALLESWPAGRDRAGYLAHLRGYAHAARWSPTLAVWFAEALLGADPQMPDMAADVRQVVLALTQTFHFDDLALQEHVRVVRLAALIDAGKYEAGWAEVRAFEQVPVPGERAASVMARLEGLLALRSQMNEADAIAALERVLASPNYLSKRAFSAITLADLYRHAGRVEEETKLLERELASPGIKAAPDDEALLRARLKRSDDPPPRKSTPPVGAEIVHWLAADRRGW